MPFEALPVADGCDGVLAKLGELEAASHDVAWVKQVGDQYVIAYRVRPKPGRPKKVETR
jgi:hypothetical protein